MTKPILILTAVLLMVAAVIIIAVRLTKKSRYKARLLAAKPKIAGALSEFKSLCNPGREFTVEESESFKSKNEELLAEAKQLSACSLLSAKLKEEASLRYYISIVVDIDQNRNLSNRKHEGVKYCDASMPVLLGKLRDELEDDNHFFTDSEMKEFQEEATQYTITFKMLDDCGAGTYLADEERCAELYRSLTNLETERHSHNDAFCRKELQENSSFFDNILQYPLDPQQRSSIVKLEDACLVISSAGSGKTSTMVGKIQYLVQRRGIDPKKILTITYTRKAARELSSRLANEYLQCLTFHKLALDIISEVTGRKPTVAPEDVFLNVFYGLMKTPDFIGSVVRYLEEYQSEVKEASEYQTAAEYFADRRKYGIQSLYPDMDGKIVFTKSEEEKKICNYLTHWGLDYRYEEAYEYPTETRDYRQYRPDFSIYYTDANGQRRRIYLEHFAIDSKGEVPVWFGETVEGGWAQANRDYNNGIVWKKGLHQDKGTTLIYLTSADFHGGIAEKKLRKILMASGVPVRDVPEEQLYDMIVKRSKSIEKSVLQMCQAFTTLLKANRRTMGDALAKAREAKSVRDVFIMENIMRPVYESYETTLVKLNEIDFTDAIIQATDICNKGLWKEYEYILVDEFQDISVDRYGFLQALRTKKPLTKLYCVGDDWQSIYRFAGSDMALFARFQDYFGYAEECRIETTYRFGEPLIGISSGFVQANPIQKVKSVRPVNTFLAEFSQNSPEHREFYAKYKNRWDEIQGEPSKVENGLQYKKFYLSPKTNISFQGCSDDQDMYAKIASRMASIPADKPVYIIGRYTYDACSLDDGKGRVTFDEKRDKISVNVEGREVSFLTVHSAKGLEADYVFLINCDSGVHGFPSMVSDDPVLDYVLSESDPYEFGEERRVFYVAITRAKKETIILYHIDKPSPFVTELHTEAPLGDADLCPLCKVGYKVALKRGITKNGNEYVVWGCSNHAAACTYFKREFKEV